MEKELVIQSSKDGLEIALLQDHQLVELHRERSDNRFAVGDIYLGRVKRTLAGLNAGFVDVGYEREGFLHYLDLGKQVRSLLKLTKLIKNGSYTEEGLNGFRKEQDIVKTGKIADVLSKGQLIPVQIEKEPISSKGPRLSSDISLPGRFVVLVPFNDQVSVSKKINSEEERKRLETLVKSIRPTNFGVIVRTVSEGKGVAELHKDILDLMDRWKNLVDQLRKAEPGGKILGEKNRAQSLIRDLLNDEFKEIMVSGNDLYQDLKSYLKSKAPDKEKLIRKHEGRETVFEHKGVERQIKSLFGRNVALPGGAYLIIEHTEALHVIDVNSGNRTGDVKDQEENAFKVNLDAAKEIARQLRLRDIGGIIVVDFIDMRSADNKKKLFNELKKLMDDDRARHTILPPTRFGLVQITRQRVRPEMNILTQEKCPTCNGTGEIRPSIVLTDDIQRHLDYIIKQQMEKKVTLYVHPYVYAFVKSGTPSLQWKWFMRYKKWIPVKAHKNYHLTEYRFFKSPEEEINI